MTFSWNFFECFHTMLSWHFAHISLNIFIQWFQIVFSALVRHIQTHPQKRKKTTNKQKKVTEKSERKKTHITPSTVADMYLGGPVQGVLSTDGGFAPVTPADLLWPWWEVARFAGRPLKRSSHPVSHMYHRTYKFQLACVSGKLHGFYNS